jgi:hypothetical protein
MPLSSPIKKILLATLLAGAAVAPALAQVSINIGIAPPPQQYEAVPMLAPGQVWAPGYWAWTGNRHVWVRGHAILQRDGYRWAPDHWEHRGNGYYRQPGYWVRDTRPGFNNRPGNRPQHAGPGDKHGDKHGNKHGNKHRDKHDDRGHGKDRDRDRH